MKIIKINFKFKSIEINQKYWKLKKIKGAKNKKKQKTNKTKNTIMKDIKV